MDTGRDFQKKIQIKVVLHKTHGDAESTDYDYVPDTLNFIVKISHKYFRTIKHTMTVLQVVVYIK